MKNANYIFIFFVLLAFAFTVSNVFAPPFKIHEGEEDFNITSNITTTTLNTTTTTLKHGAIVTKNITKEMHIISILKPGKMEKIVITEKGIGLVEMSMNVTNKANNVSITVAKLDGKPAYIIKEISGKVYQYMEINKTILNDTDVDKIKLKFKVEKSWINQSRINSSTVVLNRYTDDTWNPLNTTKVDEDSDYVYYESESPGLSIFAITGQEVQPVATTTLPAVVATVPVVVQPSPDYTGFIVIFIVIFVIIVIMYLVLKTKLKRK